MIIRLMISPDIQEYFDREAFDPEHGYVELKKRDEKIRHIHLHVAKAAMKLAQRDERTIVEEVIPDTAMYRSQMINIIGSEIVNDNPRAFPKKFISRVEPAYRELVTLETMALAGGHLATYLERKEHDQPAYEFNLVEATVKLHNVTMDLGERFGVDVDRAHLKRLESQMGRPIPADLVGQN